MWCKCVGRVIISCTNALHPAAFGSSTAKGFHETHPRPVPHRSAAQTSKVCARSFSEESLGQRWLGTTPNTGASGSQNWHTSQFSMFFGVFLGGPFSGVGWLYLHVYQGKERPMPFEARLLQLMTVCKAGNWQIRQYSGKDLHKMVGCQIHAY